MAQEKKCTIKKSEMREEYVYMMFSLLKRQESIILSDQKMRFNNTEIRLLFEVLSAQDKGERLISTQIAKKLGVTRSAVSQIVNHLEEKGVVIRVADAVDKKIAYIEATEGALEAYREELKKCQDFIGRVVYKFGEEKFQKMFTYWNEFVDALEEEKQLQK